MAFAVVDFPSLWGTSSIKPENKTKIIFNNWRPIFGKSYLGQPNFDVYFNIEFPLINSTHQISLEGHGLSRTKFDHSIEKTDCTSNKKSF